MKKILTLGLMLALLLTLAVFACANADDSEFEIVNGKLVRYNGSSTSVTVPEEVTVIGSSAFLNNRTITSVRFAGKVTEIQAQAFAGCTKLERVSFADLSALEKIGSYAFAGCLKLNPTWAANVKSVAGNAFDGCNVAATVAAQNTNTPPVVTLAPTPSPVATETPAPTPAPTAEPVVTAEPEVTAELEITPAPEVTAEPEITPAPEVTAEPEITPAPEVTEEPEITPVPEVTEEPEITPVPEVTEEPENPSVEEEKSEDVSAAGREGTLEIITQPTSQTVAIGDTVSFTVEAAGDGLKYQWYWRSLNHSTWYKNTLPGNKTNTLTFEATAGRMGNYYYCQITDANGNTVDTEVVRLFNANYVDLKILTQPTDQVIYVGSTARFTVEAEGEGLTYQWYWRSAKSKTWYKNTLTGNTTNTLTFEATDERMGNYYRCKITDSMGNTVTTAEVRLLLDESNTIDIISQPVNQKVNIGDKVTFKVVAEGEGLTYQWYWRSVSHTTWYKNTLSGNKTNTLSFEATEGRMGNFYRCLITDKDGKVRATVTVQLINATSVELAIVQQPTNQAVALDEMATFQIVAEGEGLTYQWYWRSATSKTWYKNTLTGNKTDILTFAATAGRMGNFYRCEVKDMYGNKVTSAEVQLTEFNPYVVLDGVTYRVEDGKAEIVSYSGTAASLTIPAEVNGAAVIRVGEGAFESNTTLTSIDLPDSIQTIGKRAFANCTNLSEIK